MATVKLSAIGKIQGSAYVKATLTRTSPNTDKMEAYAISDAKAEHRELKDRVNTLIFHESSLFVTTQNDAVSEKVALTDYKNAINEIVKGYDLKTAAQKVTIRAAAIAKAIKYFNDEYMIENVTAVSSMYASVKGMYSVLHYPPFSDAMKELTTHYTTVTVRGWQDDAKSLTEKYLATAHNTETPKLGTIFEDMFDLIIATSTNERAGSQKTYINAYLDNVDKTWSNIYLKWKLTSIENSMEAVQKMHHANDVYLSNEGKVISTDLRYPNVTTLRPFDVVTLEAEDAPLLLGYPTATDLWVRCTPVLNTTGDFISTNRATPQEVDIDSEMRWIAGEEYWDPTTGLWRPHVDTLGYKIRAADFSFPPDLVTTISASGNSILERESFRLNDGAKFHCLWNDGRDSLSTFTISMVIAPNPARGRYPVLDYWYKDEEPARGDRFTWWLGDKLDFYYGAMGGSVDQLVSFGKTRPLVITSVVTNDQCRTYVGYSHKHNLCTLIESKVKGAAPWSRFQIGGSYRELDDDEQPNFSLYEVNLWNKRLTREEVISLHSDYYSMYGVANDWS